MARPLPIFIVLLFAGVGAGMYLQIAKKSATAVSPSASSPSVSSASGESQGQGSSLIPNVSPTVELMKPSRNPVADVEDTQVQILQRQVEYLEGQVKALREENSQLIDKLAAIRQGKPGADTMDLPMKEDEESPDFVGIGIDLLKTRELKDIPIPTLNEDPQEVEALITQWLSTQFPADQGKLQGRALNALGVIHEPVDTIAAKAAFLTYQIGGWYDRDTDTIVLARGTNAVQPDKENALALGYAYLFKTYGPKLFTPAKGPVTLDSRLAQDSLMGGDAALTRFLHALAHPSKGGGGGVGEDPDDPSRSVAIPNFLRELELTPFNVGLDFAQTLHSVGGWEQVNASYGRPPVNAAEVLDPQIYLSDTPSEPLPLSFPATKVLGAEPYWKDTLGAIGVALMLKQHVSATIAADAAPKWTNDVLLSYTAEGKTRDHAVWQTLWKDSDGADAFFSAIRNSLPSRYKGYQLDANSPAGVVQMTTPERVILMKRTHNGQGVIYIDAASADFANAALGTLAP